MHEHGTKGGEVFRHTGWIYLVICGILSSYLNGIPVGGLLTNSVHSDMHMKEDQLTLVTIIASFCLPTVEVAVYEMYVDTVIWKAPEATSYRALQVAHLGSPEQYISAGTSAVM